jgi:hypothetical protein
MLKIFIAARSATSVSAAFAEVRVAGAAHAHKYFPRCAEGMGHGACVCQAAGAPGHQQLCRAG